VRPQIPDWQPSCTGAKGVLEKAMSFFDWIFGCHHTRLSRVFTVEGRTYRVCLNCAANFDYSLEKMAIIKPDTGTVIAQSRDFRIPTQQAVESII
jgi:hypothetical protein